MSCHTMYNVIVKIVFSVLFTGAFTDIKAQFNFITEAPPGERVRILWKYCTDNYISDKDPDHTHSFFDNVGRIADSLKDESLKAYVAYFKHCSLILFSHNYEDHFAKNDYKTVIRIFSEAGDEAIQNGYNDISASAEHYIGQVYFRESLYGQAFGHLLKADVMMRTVGYHHVPAVSVYLYELGLDYYRFEDFDKALSCFLEAIRYPVYHPRHELNSLNAIGLIYAKRKEYERAIAYYQKTIERAKVYGDTAWIGIASGNMGSVFLAKGSYEQALSYYRINYAINIKNKIAQSDAALCALYMAKAFVRSGSTDSALHYLKTGQQVGIENTMDQTERLHFYKTYFEAFIEINKSKGDYVQALKFADSLIVLNDTIKKRFDAKILSREVQKIDAERNFAELQLLQSQKNVSQLRLLLIIAGLVVAIAVILVLFKVYRLRKLKQAQIAEKENQLLSLEKLRAEENLKHAGEQLEAYLATIREKNEYIELLNTEVDGLKENTGGAEQRNPSSPVMESLLSKTILTDDDWRHFRNLFEQVYPGFTHQLTERIPNLSPAETRLLILSRLNLYPREMANILGISVDAIRKSRYRLRKKLNLADDADFNTIIGDL